VLQNAACTSSPPRLLSVWLASAAMLSLAALPPAVQTVGSMTGTSVPPGDIKGAPPVRLRPPVPAPATTSALSPCICLQDHDLPAWHAALSMVELQAALRYVHVEQPVHPAPATACLCLPLPLPAGPESTFSEHGRGMRDTEDEYAMPTARGGGDEEEHEGAGGGGLHDAAQRTSTDDEFVIDEFGRGPAGMAEPAEKAAPPAAASSASAPAAMTSLRSQRRATLDSAGGSQAPALRAQLVSCARPSDCYTLLAS
jgi:hypothetical protein